MLHLLQCKSGNQYVGESVQPFRKCMNAHRSDYKCKPDLPLSRYLRSDDHTKSDFVCFKLHISTQSVDILLHLSTLIVYQFKSQGAIYLRCISTQSRLITQHWYKIIFIIKLLFIKDVNICSLCCIDLFLCHNDTSCT